jgi:hypothetical protein
MMEFENTIVIKKPIKEVFAFISNFENIPKWNYYVLEVKKMRGIDMSYAISMYRFRRKKLSSIKAAGWVSSA